VDFDPETALDYARRVRPGIEVIRLSSKTGEGFHAWLAWLGRGVARASGRLEDTVAALRGRILALENELARRTTQS
jgi:hydrogenase nickel incorporation protein HypB